MFHLIERLLPSALHRVALRMAFHIRHHWRRLRKSPITGCNVIVTDLRGEILMLRHSYGPPVWGLPGGGVARGEDPAQAVRRELQEELGISGGNLRPVAEVLSEVSASPLTIHLFSLVSDRHPQADNREVIEARFFPPHSLPEPMSDATRRLIQAWRDAQKPSA